MFLTLKEKYLAAQKNWRNGGIAGKLGLKTGQFLYAFYFLKRFPDGKLLHRAAESQSFLRAAYGCLGGLPQVLACFC
jgi:hypothetical protein